MAGGALAQAAWARGLDPGRPAAGAALATGVILVAAANLHGAALLAGIAIAALLATAAPFRGGARRVGRSGTAAG